MWDDSDPYAWKRAATDWRGLYCHQEAPRRGRQQLADELGYASPSKVDTLKGDWGRLLAAAAGGDVDAAERVQRAEDLGRMLAARRDASSRPLP